MSPDESTTDTRRLNKSARTTARLSPKAHLRRHTVKSARRFTSGTSSTRSTSPKDVSFPLLQQPSLFNLLTSTSNSRSVPLNEPFPIPSGYEPTGPIPQSDADPEAANDESPSTPINPLPKSQSGILKSYRQAVFGKGTIVSVAQTDKSLPMSALTMSVDLGSRYETPQIRGLTHFLSKTFLRSTTNRVTSVLHRDMQKLGVKLTAECNRDQFIVTATTPHSRITPIIGTFFDLALNSSFDLIDLQHDLHDYSHDLSTQVHFNNYIQFQELLHAAAFGSATLGLPLYPNDPYHTDSLVSQITPNLLSNWSKQFFSSNRISFNAVNVDHQSFMSVMESRVHKLPGSSLGNYKVPKTAYVAKESHLVARSLIEHGLGVDFGRGSSQFDDYTGNPMDYVDVRDNVEQHVGIAYLAPHASHPDAPAAHIIKSMLATGLIYGDDKHPDYGSLSHGGVLTTQKSHKHRSHLLMNNQLNPQYHQQWDLKGMFDNGSEAGTGKWNPMLHYRNGNGFSPHLKQFDANYQHYNDSGLIVLHSVLPTTSVHARSENIGFMQLGAESLSSSTVTSDAMVEFHKARVLGQMSKHFTSHIHHVSQALATYSTQLGFAKRAELVDQGLNSNAIPAADLKWNTHLHHDPIDQLYAQIAQVTPDQVRSVIDKIIASPPTIVSYTAPTKRM